MAWIWVSVLGLAAETAVIIALGRRSTAAWEPADDPAAEPSADLRSPDGQNAHSHPLGWSAGW